MEFLAGLFPTVFSRYMRSRERSVRARAPIRRTGLSAEVERLDSQGDPDAAVYRFDVPLEDASLRWVRWQDGVYVPWTPPGRRCGGRTSCAAGIF